MSLKTTATIEDLYRVPENGKAELINGELVIMAATGFLPGFAGGEIYSSLRDYCWTAQFYSLSPGRDSESWASNAWMEDGGGAVVSTNLDLTKKRQIWITVNKISANFY